ncbi:MAG: recombination mediator RecR [Verrucomicrobiia bacterium]|jgi:recombination protein RecR
MPDYPAPVRQLIDALKKLPGVGPRSAERLALFIMQSEPRLAEDLASAIRSARGGIKNCSRCGSYTATDPCEICASSRRDKGLICVVERAADILRIEKTSQFGGVYHALMGKIAPLDGVGPEQLRIEDLVKRVQAEHPREVIIALGGDAQSEATTHHLIEVLKPLGVSITRIASGIPVGSGLEYADELTLGRAIAGRRPL